MYLKIGSGKIYFELSQKNLASKKTSPLFVLPGGPGLDHSIYQFHSRKLEDFAQIVYHDPRGCGKSRGFSLKNYQIELFFEIISSQK